MSKAEEVGTVLDERFRLTALVGRGAMGSVWRAEPVEGGPAVALKILHPEVSSIPELARRFEREALATAHAAHENTVEVSDFGALSDGRLFLVMELLDGIALAEVLEEERRLGPERALKIVRHVLRGLAHAHQSGVVHRDLKPENIVLVEEGGERDFAKLLDFGLAKLVGDAGVGQEQLTRAGMAMGTPTYMAPEWLSEPEVDARADLYSVAVLLYELIAGRPPFVSGNPGDVLKMHVADEPPPLSEVAPEVELLPGIEPLLERSLKKDRAQRYQDAESFAAAVEQVLAGEIPEPAPAPEQAQEPEPEAEAEEVDAGWRTPPGAVAPIPPRVEPPAGVASEAPATEKEPAPGAEAGSQASSGTERPPQKTAALWAGVAGTPRKEEGQPAPASEPPAPAVPPTGGGKAAAPAPAPAGAPGRGAAAVPAPASFFWTRERIGIAVLLAAAVVVAIATLAGGSSGAAREGGEARSGAAASLLAGEGGAEDVLDAWEDAGYEPGGFGDIDGSKLGKGKCRRGAVSGLDVTLCEYADEEAARAARPSGLAQVGDSTGAALALGQMMLIITDESGADPSGKRINELIKGFEGVARGD